MIRLFLTFSILFSSTLYSSSLFDLAKYGDKGLNKKVFYVSEAFKGVTLSFDKGEILPEHKVPFDALLVCIKGKAKYFKGKESFDMSEGSYYKIVKDSLHKIVATEKAQFILIR